RLACVVKVQLGKRRLLPRRDEIEAAADRLRDVGVDVGSGARRRTEAGRQRQWRIKVEAEAAVQRHLRALHLPLGGGDTKGASSRRLTVPACWPARAAASWLSAEARLASAAFSFSSALSASRYNCSIACRTARAACCSCSPASLSCDSLAARAYCSCKSDHG